MIPQPETYERTCGEVDLLDELHQLDGKRILELGCGAAELTRHLATGADRQVVALEVDEVQHGKNLQITGLPNVQFGLGGAEAIPAADASTDAVFMFKSLHHVPVELMDQALREIRRVLVPAGKVHISEPIYAGAFNDLLRLFHDEGEVRAAAFAAIERAVSAGGFELASQSFYLAPVCFEDFTAFEHKIIGATHTHHELSAEIHTEVQQRFATHMGPDGARFLQPMRIDLLRTPR